jgi:hypothetical protein
MKKQTLLFLGLGSILFTSSFAQTWIDEYQRGLDAAKSGDWAIARERFQKAATFRGDDSNVASELPGGSGRNRTVWRAGAPYSPNFAASYSGYRLALETADTGERTKLLMTVARELEALLKKNQHSVEAYYTLALTYNLLRDQDMVDDTEKREQENARLGWKVDSEFMSPDEQAAVTALRQQLVAVKPPESTTGGGGAGTTGQTTGSTTGTSGATTGSTTGTSGATTGQTTGTTTGGTTGATPPATTGSQGASPIPKGPPIKTIKAGDLAGMSPNGQYVTPNNVTGRVPTLPYKYALVVGNTESLLPDGRMNYAATDAAMVADALKQNAGYDDANVEVLLNATADQIRISAQAMADRIPENATITLFMSGVGQNVAGDDYFAGVESQTMYDTTTMVKVDTLLRAFMAKGARIFLFYQVSRPIRDGRYFGQKPPEVGAVAQMMGTMPGSMVGSIVDKGLERGIYALAFARTLEQTRSNQIHIMDFGWSVFNSMKGGNPASPGGGGNQVPTLPVLSYLSNDARF